MKTLLALTVIATFAFVVNAQPDDTEAFWNDFTSSLLAGRITADRVRPYYPQLQEPMMRYLEYFRQHASPEEWKAKPELYRVGNEIHGIVALTGPDGKKAPFCFSLLVENQQWYFQRLESIFIRLDQTGPLPTSHFPDVAEAQKIWMQDERRVNEEIRVYNVLSKEKGREFALDFLNDGLSYALEARTWVPLVPPSKAFVLFLCWEQANLCANPLTLQSLNDNSAVVRWQPRWFKLYRQTAYLQQWIPEAEFRNIFETTWQDRARAAGWSLQIDYDQDEVVFRLKR